MNGVLRAPTAHALLGLAQLIWLSCAPPARVSAPSPHASAAAAGMPAQPARCPRVERAKRMWIGFARDVANEDMTLALDMIVPIQECLGKSFCTAGLADARPAEVISIELADAVPNSARVMLSCVQQATRRDLALTLEFVAGDCRPAPDSLAAYLAACRSPSAEGARQ